MRDFDQEEIVEEAISRINELEAAQLIDPTSNLEDRAVIILSGS